MKLGGSIRRRRASRSGERGWLRLVGMAALSLVVGLSTGWVVATRVLFPAPPPPGDLYEVPDVRGLDVATGGERLDRSGLSLGVVSGIRHPRADSGRVVGQAPLPGQLAPPNAPVGVTVSLGPERRSVPDVVALDASWARNVLESTGFRVIVDSVESPAAPGRVVEVVPEEGTELALPAEVTMVVSLGPPRVAMPRVVGLEEEAARDTLEALGLEVGEVEEVFRFGRDQGIVVRQEPPADSLVERGAEVRLSVGRRGRGGRRR